MSRGLALLSRTSPADNTTPLTRMLSPMRDEKAIRTRLEQLRSQFLQWGTPDLQVFVITKDELRGWIRALEWVLLKASTSATWEVSRDVRQPSKITPKDQSGRQE